MYYNMDEQAREISQSQKGKYFTIRDIRGLRAIHKHKDGKKSSNYWGRKS